MSKLLLMASSFKYDHFKKPQNISYAVCCGLKGGPNLNMQFHILLAQANDPVSTLLNWASTTLAADARPAGIIIAVVCGILFAMNHEHGVMGKVFGMVFGLAIALFAPGLIGIFQAN